MRRADDVDEENEAGCGYNDPALASGFGRWWGIRISSSVCFVLHYLVQINKVTKAHKGCLSQLVQMLPWPALNRRLPKQLLRGCHRSCRPIPEYARTLRLRSVLSVLAAHA